MYPDYPDLSDFLRKWLLKIEIWTILREKTTEKPKMLFFRSFAKTEEQ